ncbi:MAG: hypothetical protein WEF50_05740 [Myxococcota bacterium]
MRLRFHVAIASAALALSACSGEPESPEAAVRATLAAIEAAAGERDVDGVRSRISDAYADARGNDKAEVVQVAAFHLLRNQAVYTLSRIQSVDTSEPGRARVDLLVAMAGKPIDDAEALLTVNADLYRFEVALGEEEPGTWRVTSSSWQRATLADFR